MEIINLLISDETLRDGEQQVGLFFEDKETLAHLIARTGVHQIALMPAVHATESQLVNTLVSRGLQQQIIASTLMTRTAIEQSKACGVEQIILFHAVSDRLLLLRDPAIAADPTLQGKTIDDDIPTSLIERIRQNALETSLEHIRYARSLGLRVCFAAEDASRADFYFLGNCIETLSPYLDFFLLCDTVGVLTPEKSYIWLQDLLTYAQSAPLAVHFHNDMGLALENTIQAVRAGAMGVSGTFCGIGERAGNLPLEQLLYGLRSRFGWEVAGINYDEVEKVVCYLRDRRMQPHPPYSPATQRHESGIHVSSLYRDRQSYHIFPHSPMEIWFGKGSGVSNFQYLFEHYLKQPLDRAQYEHLRTVIKTIAIQEQKSFSVTEVLELIKDRGLLRE
ncbi:2-isopropylmalate synthase [Spirulina sp. 06S082]|uniref:2-isopropylmalate synthase n=1 Tax=Spirulina sp. 06S082 TaxID=3110248 RepID=UPI002B1E911C|nr:2-isopropylmalate synthase [Spirulina sp. 06S082]MEA5472137.1 2-isopropylmalate synthase [Spirulina sp. 06S082]